MKHDPEQIFTQEVEIPEVVRRKVDDTLSRICRDADSHVESADPLVSTVAGQSCRRVRQKEDGMKIHTTTRRPLINRAAAAAAIVVITLSAVGGSAYAAYRHFGLLDFAGALKEDIPEEAADAIATGVPQSVTDGADNAVFDCTVREALRDGETLMLVYEVAAKDSGKYLFIPEYADENDDMGEWSGHHGITVEDYANACHRFILHVGGGISNREELGIAEASMSFQSVADDVMDVYIRCGTPEDAGTEDIILTATAWAGGSDEAVRQELTFPVEEMSGAATRRYVPEQAQGAVAQAAVIQTKLGTYVDIVFNAYPTAGQDDHVVVARFFDDAGQEVEMVGGSGVETAEDGCVTQRYIFNQTEFGESFAVEFVDGVDGTDCGRVVLVAK